VEPRSNYQDYRPELRANFWFSCAYCTLTEVESRGVGFQIDHYVPIASDATLQNVYGNLMYSCAPCNRNKGDYHPTAAQDAAGKRFFRADQEHPSDHFETTQNTVVGTTAVGEFTTEVLMLNRLLMQRVRRARRRITESEATVTSGIHALRSLPIESLPLPIRGRFMQVRAQLDAAATGVIVADEVWKEIVRSRMLDDDPERVKLLEARRWALAEAKALSPSPAKLRPSAPKKKK
jgi:hypothetical protein